ncbi:MAG: hypothetical protein R3C99_03405 [Pirellulaceae bacterium]
MPQSVVELWADFDPPRTARSRNHPRVAKEDGGLFRLVRHRIGTFKGQPARMAAIYGFPADTTERLPAVMHIHGGGQRAFLHEVKLLVARGYAGLSINWGGNGDGRPPFNSPDGFAGRSQYRLGRGRSIATERRRLQLDVAGSEAVFRGPRASEEQQPGFCSRSVAVAV